MRRSHENIGYEVTATSHCGLVVATHTGVGVRSSDPVHRRASLCALGRKAMRSGVGAPRAIQGVELGFKETLPILHCLTDRVGLADAIMIWRDINGRRVK